MKTYSSGLNNADDLVISTEGILKLDAILMRLQAIGEMVKNVDKRDKNFLSKYSEVDWVEIIKMRDIISHHYMDVNAQVVYKICAFDIPVLCKTVDKILIELDEQLKAN